MRTRTTTRSRTARADEPRLQLLTRAGCHLCETAEETLAGIAGESGLALNSVDVDADPELQAEYGDRVPVVLLDGREHSYFAVDVPRLRRDLTAAGGPACGRVVLTTVPPVRGRSAALGWSATLCRRSQAVTVADAGRQTARVPR